MRKQVRFLITGMVSVFLVFGLASCQAKPISDIDELKTAMQAKGYEVQTVSYNDRSDGMTSELTALISRKETRSDGKISIGWHSSRSLSGAVDPDYEVIVYDYLVVEWYESYGQAKQSYDDKRDSFLYNAKKYLGKSKKMVYYASSDFVLEDASS